MTARTFGLLVALIICSAGAQVGWHALLRLDNRYSRSARSFYVSSNYPRSQGKPFIGPILDLVLPGIVTGVVYGAMRKSPAWVEPVAVASLIGLANAALQLVYRDALGLDVWWLDAGPGSRVGNLSFHWLIGAAFCLMPIMCYRIESDRRRERDRSGHGVDGSGGRPK